MTPGHRLAQARYLTYNRPSSRAQSYPYVNNSRDVGYDAVFCLCARDRTNHSLLYVSVNFKVDGSLDKFQSSLQLKISFLQLILI